MVWEPEGLPEIHFSLRNIIRTGGQYSSQMRAVSPSQLMVDAIRCGNATRNVSQTVQLWTLTGTLGAHHGLDRDTLGLPTCMCLLEVIQRQQDIVVLFWSLMSGHIHAVLALHSFYQDNARSHTARMSLTFLDDNGISMMNCPARSPDLNPLEHILNILSRCIRQGPHHLTIIQLAMYLCITCGR